MGQTEMELLRLFSGVLPWILWWLPLAAMVVLWAVCVIRLPGKRQRLLLLFSVAAALGLVLFGGAWVLGQRGLAWRTWFQEAVSVLLWLAGLALGIFTVYHFHGWLQEARPKIAPWGMALGLYCLICVMLFGTLLGGLWAMGPGEQVVTYDGQTVILGTWTWMERTYSLYEYHGPLVRGAGPFLVDWDENLVEGAVNVPWDIR